MNSILACALALFLPAAALAQGAAQGLSRIGAAGAVKGLVRAQSKGAVGRVLDSGKPLYLNDHVTTDKAGRLQVMLLDETVFTLGPNSDMVLDEFVYDPETESGRVAARLTKGVFRFVTGKVARKDPANMKVKLPVGTVGIRGTMAIGQADANSSTVILLGPGSHGNTDENKGAISFDYNGVTRRIDHPGAGVTCVAGQAPSKVSDLSARAIELNEILSPSAAAATGGDDSSGGAATDDSGESIAKGLAYGQGQGPDADRDQALIHATFEQNGIARWEGVRHIESGIGYYQGAGTYQCLQNCSGTGAMDFNIDINFGARTLGGTGSFIRVSNNGAQGVSLTDSASLNAISFANLSGPAEITLNGSMYSAGFGNFDGTQITLINANGVPAGEAAVDLKYISTASEQVQGSMAGPLY